MTPIKAIRIKCLDCSAESEKEVRLCPILTCSLYPFRMGKNPNISPSRSLNFTKNRPVQADNLAIGGGAEIS
jgi:hypothetical protein